MVKNLIQSVRLLLISCLSLQLQLNSRWTFPVQRRPKVKIRREANQAEKTGSGRQRTTTAKSEFWFMHLHKEKDNIALCESVGSDIWPAATVLLG